MDEETRRRYDPYAPGLPITVHYREHISGKDYVMYCGEKFLRLEPDHSWVRMNANIMALKDLPRSSDKRRQVICEICSERGVFMALDALTL